MKDKLYDTNINSYKELITPKQLIEKIPLDEKEKQTVFEGRKEIEQILTRENTRKIFIVGPCSIHDYTSSIEYAVKLKELSEKVKDKILIVMRTYFEKPRTTVGWKGFINDPDLNDSFNIQIGLEISRKLLLEIARLGIPAGTEFLDPITPAYIADLISWTAIGARTTESQTHRQMVSGLSMPVGFKNGTRGGIDMAINAIKSSVKPHSFIGINWKGEVCAIETLGNNYCHIILRGSEDYPNYEKENVSKIQEKLKQQNLRENVMIDCSHGNSSKDYNKQSEVFKLSI